MSTDTKQLKLVFHYYPETGTHNVSDIELGSFLGSLTDEPKRLARRKEDGSIKIEVERTHEWEIVVGLVITGSAIFAKSFLETLGKRLGNLAADWLERKLKNLPVKVRAEEGNETELGGDIIESRSGMENILKSAAEKNGTVVVLFPWEWE